MNRVVLFAFFVWVSATGAMAGYVSNFSDWKQKSPFAQSQYAMGLLDGQLTPSIEDKSAIAASMGLNLCAYELGLTGEMIAEAITKYYETHTSMWGAPPVVGFHEEIMSGACLRHINTERAKYSLDPWKKQ